MSSYKKILVAVDVDGCADQVLKKAAEFNQGEGVEYTVLNVAPSLVQMYGMSMGAQVYNTSAHPFDEDEVRQSIFPKLEALAGDQGLGSQHIVVDFGRAVDGILERAVKLDVDLIVLGSHGRHGLSLLLGSTANGVLHRAKCDVLAVRIEE